MKRLAFAILATGLFAGVGFCQYSVNPFGRTVHPESRPGSSRGNVTPAGYRFGGAAHSSPSSCDSCRSCGNDNNCIRKLIDFACYRPQGGETALRPDSQPPSLLAWFPNGSPYCNGDCGTHAACRDRFAAGRARNNCGSTCADCRSAGRNSMGSMRYSGFRNNAPTWMHDEGSPNSDEPPLLKTGYNTAPAAQLRLPSGYRTQPGTELLPYRR